ncbi:MAG: prolyl oligopeptidase family serine peptidase, partial [Ginsengibacter sp.]
VYRMPKTFAAAFVICGAADPSTAKKLKKTNWWIFHGQKDSAISVEYGKEMATALKKAGAKVKLTIYPEDGHNSWDDAFKEPGLFEWMFSKKIKIN